MRVPTPSRTDPNSSRKQRAVTRKLRDRVRRSRGTESNQERVLVVPTLRMIPAPAGMAQADLPAVIVLAVGAASVGAPEALALLLDVGGRNPPADVVIAVFLIAAVTSLVLGTMLLARYVRVAANGGALARLHQQHPGTGAFARVTLAVALAVAVSVAACLLAVPSARGLGGAATTCSCSA